MLKTDLKSFARMLSKVGKRLALPVIICISISFPLLNSTVNATPNNLENPDQKISSAYLDANYSLAAKLLEEQIRGLKGTLREDRWSRLKSKRGTLNQLYQRSFVLANLYAWRLNAPGKALAIYQEINELKRSHKDVEKVMPIEFLFIGEIFEKMGKPSKAVKYYRRLLEDVSALQEETQDDVTFFIGREIVNLTRYRIDGINLKLHGKGGFTPLLGRLKLPSSDGIVQFMMLALSAEAMYGYQEAMADLAAHIKNSPDNIASMVANYSFAIQASAGEVDRSSLVTLGAYLAKYPESYYSLSLRYLFYRHHLDNGELEKARGLSGELERIAKKRSMEPLIGPDSRFSSPEKTWETYENAFAGGDYETAAKCYIGDNWRSLKAFKRMDRARMKQAAGKMGRIVRLEGNAKEAKYAIKAMVKGKEMTSYMNFYNIDGEWKMKFTRP